MPRKSHRPFGNTPGNTSKDIGAYVPDWSGDASPAVPDRNSEDGGGTRAARAGSGFLPRKFHPMTYNNPDGLMKDFGYDILKRAHRGNEHSALAYVRQKLRHDSGPLTLAPLHRDVAANMFLVPPDCPDVLADAESFWHRMDAEVLAPDQHLLAGPTIWFPTCVSQHMAIRRVREFAQACIADRHDVAVHLVAHAPNRIGHISDFHVHLLASARTVSQHGLGGFARALFQDGCQIGMKDEWEAQG